MTVTAEGLRIELMESEKGTFFEVGSPEPSQSCHELLVALAHEIAKLPNHVSIEGHTDSRPYGTDSYSNWELSVDRANAARRLMQAGGLGPDQISQVRGYSDRHLRYRDDPQNPGNRRISLIVQYQNFKESDEGSRPTDAENVHAPVKLVAIKRKAPVVTGARSEVSTIFCPEETIPRGSENAHRT